MRGCKVIINESVIDAFLSLIPLRDATFNTLYNLVEFFNENEIPSKLDMISFAEDVANTM